MPSDLTKVSDISKACSPVSGCEINNSSMLVFYEKEALFNWLRQQPASIVLMMSSGHFGGLDLQRLVD